jgi:hypothetical protein
VRRDGSHRSLQIGMTSLQTSGYKKQAILANGLSDLRFEYLDATDRSATWLSTWQDRTNLPVAIRVMSADSTHWPPLVIRLAIAETTTCVFDPERMTCHGL